MVPIHDSDIAEERWSKTGWDRYELWEKIELRLRRNRRFWIGGAVLLFLAFSAIPVFMDRIPKWKAMSLSRQFAQEVSALKRQASMERAAFRIRVLPGSALALMVEKGRSCADSQFAPVRQIRLESSGEFGVLTPNQGAALGIPGLVSSFCYDSLSGSDAVLHGEALVGFGLIPVNDLTARRMDRISILLLKGPSAEISFD
ncbi:MAG: hypothetical protein ACXWPM_04620 [Bdellovibrionota bacterium]